MSDQESDEERYTDQMIQVKNGFELKIAKYKEEINVVEYAWYERKQALEDRKYALEERKQALMLSMEKTNENHSMVQMRMLKINKEIYDMCMEDDNTDDEESEINLWYKEARVDILNDTLDKWSTQKLISSRGVRDSDGLVSDAVNDVIANAAIREKKRRRSDN
jgi:hypothetical protein